ncbi:MAG: hypothetical protein ACC609_04720 [Methanobacterium formicicum]
MAKTERLLYYRRALLFMVCMRHFCNFIGILWVAGFVESCGC